MSLITRRSSTRALPRVSAGRCGLTFENCAFVSQNWSRIIYASFSEAVNHATTFVPTLLWVRTLTSVLGFYVMVLILITQRHENRLEETRAQLTLQVAMLAERKNAKIIELLEQLRRDHPNIVDRVDEDATAMSEPTDAEAVIEAITVPEA